MRWQIFFADGMNLKTESSAQPSGLSDPVSRTSDAISGMAISATLIYFAQGRSNGSDGVIYKAPSQPNCEDAVPLRIARGQLGPRSLSVGSKKVYWSTARCTIESQDL